MKFDSKTAANDLKVDLLLKIQDLTEEIENFIERDRKIELIDYYLERAMIYEKLNTNQSKELVLKDVKSLKNWEMKPINAMIDFESLEKSMKNLMKMIFKLRLN